MKCLTPQIKIVKNEIIKDEALFNSIVIPKFKTVMRIETVPGYPAFKCVFHLLFEFDMQSSIKSRYNFHVQYSTEILEDGKPIPLWGLNDIADRCLGAYEILLNENLDKNGFLSFDIQKDVNKKEYHEKVKDQFNCFLTRDLLDKL